MRIYDILTRSRNITKEVGPILQHLDLLRRIYNYPKRSEAYKETIVKRMDHLEDTLIFFFERMVDCQLKAIVLLLESRTLTEVEFSVLYRYYILAERVTNICKLCYISERSYFYQKASGLQKLIEEYEGGSHEISSQSRTFSPKHAEPDGSNSN